MMYPLMTLNDDPLLEPVHVRMAEGNTARNATRVWIERGKRSLDEDANLSKPKEAAGQAAFLHFPDKCRNPHEKCGKAAVSCCTAQDCMIQ